ncbi:MAG TPA: hypothetical protein VK112_14240 [Fodinibius sp.]|nr:hypothetical protein [Fodinibius sp.]
MEAIEFKTTPKKDGTIQIPKKYRNQFTAEVRVVVMQKERSGGGDRDIINHLMESSLEASEANPLSKEASRRRGRRMVEVLKKIAKSGGISSIEDPSEWQREQRTDRPLPGREGA